MIQLSSAVTRITAVRRVGFAENFSVTQRVPFIAVNRVKVENRRSHHRAFELRACRGFDELPLPRARLIFQCGEHAGAPSLTDPTRSGQWRILQRVSIGESG